MITTAFYSLLMRACQAVVGFATVRALIGMWGTEQYGIWVTFTSVVAYLTMFDLGIGYGIRNRVAEAFGSGTPERAENVIRAGIAVYAAAAGTGLAIAIWGSFFVSPFAEHLLAAMVLWAGCAVSFFLSFHATILQALGRFKTLATLTLMAPTLWFATIFLWSHTLAEPFTLEAAAAIFAGLSILQALATTTTLSRQIKGLPLWPRDAIDWELIRTLVTTGLKFFVLQVTALVLNSTGNLLIYRHLGGRETAHYDAANKVFGMFTLGFSVLIGIAWTEISKAKAAGDVRKLRRIYWLLHVAAALTTAIAFICALQSTVIIHALTRVTVTTADAMPFVVMIGVQTFSFASAVYLNAYEQLRWQIATAILAVPVFVALAFYSLHAGVGIGAIPLASTGAMLPALFVCAAVAYGLIYRNPAQQPTAQGAA